MKFFSEEQYLSWMDELADTDYLVVDNYIDSQLYTKILSFFEAKRNEESLKKAGIGALGHHMINSEIRGDYIFWIDKERDTDLAVFFHMAEELIHYLRSFCFLSISDAEFHLALYPKGSFYKKHIDQFNERSNRLISFVLYLNANWQSGDGGELLVYKDEQIKRIEPIQNRLVLFKSDKVAHEVAVTHKDRLSLTGWMLNNPVGLGFL